MIRPLALVMLLLAPGLAAAQTQDCVAAGLVAVEGVTYGTQRVPRDPRNPGSSELLTLSVAVRNVSPQPVQFTARFPAPAVQQDFLTGQRWQLSAGASTTLIVANVLRPGMPDGTVRQVLRLSCG